MMTDSDFREKENLPPLFKENLMLGRHTPDTHDESTPDQRKPRVIPSIQDFTLIKPISRGAFGKVFLGNKKDKPQRKYAIKIMKKADMIHKNMVNQVIAERNALALSKSPFIVHLYYSLQSQQNIYLVMEYMIGGDVKSLLTIYGFFDEEMAIIYISEVILALEYLHQHGIIHRDLKPDNMLLSHTGHIKLTDFGLSKVDHKSRISIGDIMRTPGLRGPVSYHRTPGQILSLTSNFAFGLTASKHLQLSCKKAPSSAGSFASPAPFKGSFGTPCLRPKKPVYDTGDGVHCTPPPIKSLTPTLKASMDWHSSVSEQSSVANRTRPISRASYTRTQLDSIPGHDNSVFLSDSTPRSVTTMGLGFAKSSAAQNMKFLREGQDLPSSNKKCSVDFGEPALNDVSYSSIELRRHCESSGSPEFTRKPSICADDACLSGSKKRPFDCVEKSPLTPKMFSRGAWERTGLTGEFAGVSLGDEHRLKRLNASEIPEPHSTSAPNYKLDFLDMSVELTTSCYDFTEEEVDDECHERTPTIDQNIMAPDPDHSLPMLSHVVEPLRDPPSPPLSPGGTSRDRLPLSPGGTSRDRLGSIPSAPSVESQPETLDSSLNSSVHNMSIEETGSDKQAISSDQGSPEYIPKVDRSVSCPDLRQKVLRFAAMPHRQRSISVISEESSSDYSGFNDADVSDFSESDFIDSPRPEPRQEQANPGVSSQDPTVANCDTNCGSPMVPGQDHCDNTQAPESGLQLRAVVPLRKPLLPCKSIKFMSLPGAVSDSEGSGVCRTPLNRLKNNVFMTPARAGCHTPFRTPKSVRRGGAAKDDRILGTPDYLAPELLLHKDHGPGVDWWALGVCLYEFLTGAPPFNDITPEAVFQHILNRNLQWPEGEEALSENAKDCIEKLLDMNPDTRPRAAGLKKHALLQSIDWETLHNQEAPFVPVPDDDTDTSYFDARNDLQDLKVSQVDMS